MAKSRSWSSTAWREWERRRRAAERERATAVREQDQQRMAQERAQVLAGQQARAAEAARRTEQLRPNLLELSPTEFECFIQHLFSKMEHIEAKLFRASNDGGVDCVAYDTRSIFGGKFVVQAKLYTKQVPPSAVRDLYGTMQHEGATKGILITTSG